ncbi:unnamed protein product [Spirodela intermedia]|uniref:Uncharacterized protein n=1 Tax=Spirodela intermedia TaxID=51605 RepID=A0A7I8L9P0_SPIIN|nr:unnamed protein product [Spirodela intermedia]
MKGQRRRWRSGREGNGGDGDGRRWNAGEVKEKGRRSSRPGGAGVLRPTQAGATGSKDQMEQRVDSWE